jgi:hypothetical protein
MTVFMPQLKTRRITDKISRIQAIWRGNCWVCQAARLKMAEWQGRVGYWVLDSGF